MATKSFSLYVVRVLPIVRGFRDSEATYFSSTPFLAGSLISVPFRNKERSAIVLSSSNLAEEKSEIKKGDFSLRKIKPQKGRLAFTPSFLDAVHELSLHYASTAGEILSALVPASVLEDTSFLNFVGEHTQRAKKPTRTFLQGVHMENPRSNSE
jgi:primosomal protein N'